MDPLERIRELLGRITDLSGKELDELDAAIAKVWGKADAAQDVPQMTELLDAKKAAKGERDGRAAKEAEAAAQAQALRDQMAELSGVDGEGNPIEAEPEVEVEPEVEPVEAEAEAEPIAAAAYEPEPYAPEPDETVGCPACKKMNDTDASYCDQCGEKLAGNADVVPPAAAQADDGGGPDNAGGDGAPPPPAAASVTPISAASPRKSLPAAMAATRPRPQPSPERAPEPKRGIAMTATSGLSNYNPGDSMGFWGESDTRLNVAKAMADKIHRVGKNGPGEHVVARADWGDLYPEDRRFGDDPVQNALIPITASGGVALPVDADFSIMGFLATAETPFLNSLPAYNANRGGLRYVQPIDISAVSSGIATWTEATDANPGDNTKPVYQISVQTEQLVYVDAVVTRLEFGNFSRFYPEQVAMNIDAAAAMSARDVELHLLGNVVAGSQLVTSAKTFGTVRDLLPTLDLLLANARTQRRWPRSVGLNIVLNDWVKDMCRADIARQLATGGTNYEPLAVTDAQIEEWFTIRGVKPTWVLDGIPGATQSAVTYVAQSFAGQTAGQSLNDWPTEVCATLYPDGQFQLLDGGTLDLGIIRDSLLSASNDYQIFTERFVNIAQRGVANGSQFLVATTHPYGSSSATVAANSNH